MPHFFDTGIRMPFSQHKLDEVQRGIRHALASTSLNEWERDFLRDMQCVNPGVKRGHAPVE
jgi:hypothetical protein